MTEEPDLSFIPETEQEEVQQASRAAKLIAWLVGFFVATMFAAAIGALLVFNLNKASESFPINEQITIEQGTDVREITRTLQEEGVVRSAGLLYYVIILFHDPTTLKASSYVFDQPLTTYEVAKRLTVGDFDTDLVRITFIEGERTTQFAEHAIENIENFDTDAFLELAVPLEGTLFPDTYFLPKDYTAEQLVELLRKSYLSNTEELRVALEEHPLGETGVITLASIVEREANSSTSKQMVAGIFMNRLDIGMALQADASIEYVLDTPISGLRAGELAENLEEIDSPYNTYLYPGLPPTPIGNPGLDSIEAVLFPTESEYFYYITGSDGEFYYAKTYNQHLINIERHLK
tara:strand:+ start:4972 stop:6018 length:1047 start_codon:yes stop_codon:yes gene_type:complete